MRRNDAYVCMGIIPGMMGTVMPESAVSLSLGIDARRTFGPNSLIPLQKILDVVEQLCDNELCTGVDFLLQVFELLVSISVPVGMPIGVRYTVRVMSMSISARTATK